MTGARLMFCGVMVLLVVISRAADAGGSVPLKISAGTHVLLVGGGTSHDFQRWFNEEDASTLRGAGADVVYTEDVGETVSRLENADVLVLSTNQKDFDTPAFRAALMKFASAGKGIVLLHPAVWYNWNWPEYNREIVGGGARTHDPLGEFSLERFMMHPILINVPIFQARFTDELYHFEPDGNPIDVIAETMPSPETGKRYPSIWVVRHPKTRIVAIALGHDGSTHKSPAFQAFLRGAVAWVAERE